MPDEKNTLKNTNLASSFKYAILGVGYAIKHERNFKIHLVLAVLAFVVSILLKVSPVEFSLVAVSVTFVLICEMINTALENAVSLFCSEINKLAKVAKDIAAGAVLIASVNSAVIGCIIFIPKIIKILK